MQKKITVEKILLTFDPQTQNLLPALKKINAFLGYIDKEEAQKVADYFALPLAKIYETASFYDLIKTQKPAHLEIKICSGGDCLLAGSEAVAREIENYFHIKVGDEFNPRVRLEKISCLGHCAEGPIVLINGKMYQRVTKSSIYGILKEWA